MISKSPYESQQFFYLKTEEEVNNAVQTACELLHKSISSEEEHYVLPLMVDSPSSGYFSTVYDKLEHKHRLLHDIKKERESIHSGYYRNLYSGDGAATNENNINSFVRGNLSLFLPEFIDNLPEISKTDSFLQNIGNDKFPVLNRDFYLDQNISSIHYDLKRVYPSVFIERMDLTDILKDKVFNRNKVKLNVLVNVRTEKINFYEDISSFCLYASIIPFYTQWYKKYLNSIKDSNAPTKDKMFKTLVKSMETNLSGALAAFVSNNNSVETDKKINFLTRMQQVIVESTSMKNDIIYEGLRKILKAANFDKDIILTTVSFIPVLKGMFEPKQAFISKKLNFYSWDVAVYLSLEGYMSSSQPGTLYSRTVSTYNNHKARIFESGTIYHLERCLENKHGCGDIPSLGLPLKLDTYSWVYQIIKGNVFAKDTAHITKTTELTIFKDLTNFNSFINKLYSTGVNDLSLWFNKRQTPIQIPEELSKIENRLNLHYLMSSDIHSFFDKIIESKFRAGIFSLAMFIIYERNSLPLKLFSEIMGKTTKRKENYEALLVELSKDKELLTWAVGKRIPSLLYFGIQELYNYLEQIEPKKRTPQARANQILDNFTLGNNVMPEEVIDLDI